MTDTPSLELAYLEGWRDAKSADRGETAADEWLLSETYAAALHAEPVAAGEQWCAIEGGEQRTAWRSVCCGDMAGWQALAKRSPEKYAVKVRTVYALTKA